VRAASIVAPTQFAVEALSHPLAGVIATRVGPVTGGVGAYPTAPLVLVGSPEPDGGRARHKLAASGLV
jgi:hypothetical protein